MMPGIIMFSSYHQRPFTEEVMCFSQWKLVSRKFNGSREMVYLQTTGGRAKKTPGDS
jgi:hypothetical protein